MDKPLSQADDAFGRSDRLPLRRAPCRCQCGAWPDRSLQTSLEPMGNGRPYTPSWVYSCGTVLISEIGPERYGPTSSAFYDLDPKADRPLAAISRSAHVGHPRSPRLFPKAVIGYTHPNIAGAFHCIQCRPSSGELTGIDKRRRRSGSRAD